MVALLSVDEKVLVFRYQTRLTPQSETCFWRRLRRDPTVCRSFGIPGYRGDRDRQPTSNVLIACTGNFDRPNIYQTELVQGHPCQNSYRKPYLGGEILVDWNNHNFSSSFTSFQIVPNLLYNVWHMSSERQGLVEHAVPKHNERHLALVINNYF